jgi:protein-S-isoprenylcysteine O-methyltransferase Ste14
MYLGLAVLYCGLAVLLDRAWPLLFLPLSILLIDRLVIPREERYLGHAFGEDYERYRREVRRWL